MNRSLLSLLRLKMLARVCRSDATGHELHRVQVIHVSNAGNNILLNVLTQASMLNAFANGEICTQQGLIHVWLLPSSMFGSMEQYCNILSNEEIKKAARFTNQEAASRYRAARLVSRFALSAACYQAVTPKNWIFAESPYGKLALVSSRPSLHFNISHNEKAVVVAISPSPVGIDIEDLLQIIPLDLYELSLSARERRDIEALPERDRSKRFIELWTLKEAYSKMLGFGQSTDFSKIEITTEPPSLVRDDNFLTEEKHLSPAFLATIFFRQGSSTQLIALASSSHIQCEPSLS